MTVTATERARLIARYAPDITQEDAEGQRRQTAPRPGGDASTTERRPEPPLATCLVAEKTP
jgi:hypothetical protein